MDQALWSQSWTPSQACDAGFIHLVSKALSVPVQHFFSVAGGGWGITEVAALGLGGGASCVDQFRKLKPACGIFQPMLRLCWSQFSR